MRRECVALSSRSACSLLSLANSSCAWRSERSPLSTPAKEGVARSRKKAALLPIFGVAPFSERRARVRARVLFFLIRDREIERSRIEKTRVKRAVGEVVAAPESGVGCDLVE